MKVIVGLGNPGLKYKNNRHNVGFMVVDKIAQKCHCVFKKGFGAKGYRVKTRIGKEDVILLKPATFMNNSGMYVKKVAAKNRITNENLLIIYDDADLPLGKLRVKKSSSSGGHQGMESIIQKLEHTHIPRVKIGIGKPVNKDLADYVLSDFSGDEKDEIENVISIAASACVDWINLGIDKVMEIYNK